MPIEILDQKPDAPSCWGCGHDYLERWAVKDLCHMEGLEQTPLCPDCHEELMIDGMEEINDENE